jgi:L-seryl-tRNA(Ser) seleniumtransferase
MTNPMPTEDARRRVPRTDRILADDRLGDALELLGADTVKGAVRDALARVRAGELDGSQVVATVLAALPNEACSLRSVLNATGVVLHTNLGRAPLSADAVRALATAAGYVDVEFDLDAGVRARRGRGTLDALLARVPAAQDALVVNNGAAALVLAATVLAPGREIIVSRGELVEIGDGFRIPDLLASTGSRLREVGTTNRTHLADYAAAVGPDTGFVLKVHPSNFEVRGFTSAVSTRELATLGAPVVADIGSGLLAPRPDLPGEPDAASSLTAGAALVTASGDKLLGGPQAGLILGSRSIVAQLRRHPLARALRVDKLSLAALEATLIGRSSPIELAMSATESQLRERAEALAGDLQQQGIAARAQPSDGLIGGGGAPGLVLPGWAVHLPVAYATTLRRGRPSVVARVERGRCVIDVRCVPIAADPTLYDAILAARAAGASDAEPPCT